MSERSTSELRPAPPIVVSKKSLHDYLFQADEKMVIIFLPSFQSAGCTDQGFGIEFQQSKEFFLETN